MAQFAPDGKLQRRLPFCPLFSGLSQPSWVSGSPPELVVAMLQETESITTTVDHGIAVTQSKVGTYIPHLTWRMGENNDRKLYLH